MREIGEVRKELSGEEAAPYMGLARTVLGQLKNDMAFNGLSQGMLTKRLPDGTVVTVRSSFGQDKIAITKPLEEAAPREEAPAVLEQGEEKLVPTPVTPPYDEVTALSIVVCGTCTDESNVVYRPWVWRPGHEPIEIFGAVSARAHAISGDGRVVVGSFKRGVNDEGAFRWTQAEGMIDLGRVVAGVTPVAGATGANHDGSVIVGMMGDVEFVWTSETGMVQLPGSYSDHSFGSPCVSPNGRFIAGSRATHPDGFDVAGGSGSGVPAYLVANNSSVVAGGMLWYRAGAGITAAALPPSGDYTYRLIVVNPGVYNFTWTTPIEVLPMAVTDTGTVAGVGHTGVVIPLGGAPERMYPSGGTPYPNYVGGPGAISLPVAVPTEWVAGITSSGRRSAGFYLGDRAPFVWTRGQGLAAFDDTESAVYAMASTGVHFAGARGERKQAYHLGIKRIIPMLWTARGPQTIPLLPGATRGWADGISASTLTVSTDPEVSPSSAV